VSSSPPKVVLVTNIPTPYRIPLFNELNRQLAERGLAFEVLFAASGYARRKWSTNLAECHFVHSFLPAGLLGARLLHRGIFLYPGLLRRLRGACPAIVITAGFGLATIKLWLRSFFSNVPYAIWSGAVLFDGMRETLVRRWLRRLLVKRAASWVTYGSDARQYLMKLGATGERVHIGINTVDVSYFAAQAGKTRALAKAQSAGPRILFVGELNTRKGVDQVLRAAAEVLKSRPDAVFDIVGSGDQEPGLKELARQLGITSSVVFHGYQQKELIAEFLGRSSCFLFCTNFDIWGLVLVEAMAAGVPCLASIRAGSTRDLIRDGQTGFAVDFSQTESVANRILWVLDHPVEAEALGARARQLIEQEVNLARSAEGFVKAVVDALPVPRTSLPSATRPTPGLNPVRTGIAALED
jgi:glycosyltransferase involved in cell wall biosynthesis